MRGEEGGGGNKRLTFPGFKAASDVELQPICFFRFRKNWREPELWTPYEGGGGGQGTRAVGGRRKAREWRMMKAAADGDGGRSDRVKQVLSKFSGALQKIQG